MCVLCYNLCAMTDRLKGTLDPLTNTPDPMLVAANELLAEIKAYLKAVEINATNIHGEYFEDRKSVTPTEGVSDRFYLLREIHETLAPLTTNRGNEEK